MTELSPKRQSLYVRQLSFKKTYDTPSLQLVEYHSSANKNNQLSTTSLTNASFLNGEYLRTEHCAEEFATKLRVHESCLPPLTRSKLLQHQDPY